MSDAEAVRLCDGAVERSDFLEASVIALVESVMR
jgi:hypothetical protein